MGTPIGLPWENRHRFAESPWTAFWRTAWDVLIRPSKTFVMMRTFGGIIEPLMYVLPPAALLALVNAFAAGSIVGSPLAEAKQIKTPGEMGALPYSLLIFAGLFAALLMAVFFLSFFCHAAVTFLQINREGLEGTFRVVCYVAGAMLVFAALPSVALTAVKILPPGVLKPGEMTLVHSAYAFLGLLGMISTYAGVVGIRDVHGSGNSRAAWSCVFGVLLLALAGTFVYKGLKGGKGAYKTFYGEEIAAEGSAPPLPPLP